MRHPPATKREAMLPAPIIEVRNAYDEIDLQELGDDDLVTYIHYEDIAEGDRLRILWRGATAQGEELDSVNVEIEVEAPYFDSVTKRMRVDIANRFLKSGDQGYAFYSYERLTGTTGESLRTFSFVGVRPHRMEHMPVAQAIESHALHIDPSALGSGGVNFVAPPYAAMRKGDTVKLIFRGYEENGDFDQEKTYSVVVGDDQVGRSLTWRVPKGEFGFISKGRAEVHYQIDFVDHEDPLDGPVQTYRIDTIPADPELLPPLEILNYTGGPLDPEKFLDGLMVHVPPYPELHTADWTLLHVNDEPGVAALRADLSTLASGVQGIHLDAQVFEGVERLKLGYHVAREGVGLAGKLLDIEVLRRRNFLQVEITDGVTENPMPNMWLDAQLAIPGALVEVPDPGLRPGERLQLLWQGRSTAGKYEETLVEGSAPPYHFTIPPSVVAANMEATPAAAEKRFPVFYRLLREDLPPLESPPVQLRILPLARERYPTIQCEGTSGPDLSLGKVPETGAKLTQAQWAFMAVGQQLNVLYHGVKKDGSALVHVLRSSPVSEQEVRDREVVVILDKRILNEQKIGEPFDLKVSINFENEGADDTWFDFPPLNLKLIS